MHTDTHTHVYTYRKRERGGGGGREGGRERERYNVGGRGKEGEGRKVRETTFKGRLLLCAVQGLGGVGRNSNTERKRGLGDRQSRNRIEWRKVKRD